MSPLLWILVGSVAAIAVLVGLVMLLRMRVALARQVSETSIGLWNEFRQWLRRLFVLDLRRSMRQGIAALRGAIRMRTFRYERPWFLMIGPAGSGKTSLLRTLAEPHSINDSGLLNWGIFRNGVLLDVAGQYSAPMERVAWYAYPRRVWRTLKRLLIYHRERRPLDGIVLVLPVSLFAQFDDERRVYAERLAEQLRGIARRLGMTLPVYVVVTHADHLPGFSAFVEALPAKERQHVFGWNSPYAPEALFKRSWGQDAMAAVLERISAVQYDLLARSQRPIELFGVYDSFRQLVEPAQEWLDSLFGHTERSPWLILRGLYFSGAVANEGITDQLPGQPEGMSVAPQQVFVADLFRAKIFREPSLAQPKRQHLVRRSYASVAAHGATALVILGMIVAVAVQWKDLHQRASVLASILEQVRDDRQSYRYEREKLQNPYYYADKTRQYLTYFATLENHRLFSYGLPPSWFGALHNRLREAIARSLRDVVMVGMKEEFLRLAQLLTDPNALYLPPDTLSLRRLNLATTPEYVSFARYVQAVAEFEYHAGLYNSLAAPHRDQRLAKIIDYLYQAGIEGDVAQLIESDYRLMQRVRVDPLQLDQLRMRFAEKALVMVKRCTEKATLGNAITASMATFTRAFATVRSASSDDEVAAAFAQLYSSLNRLQQSLLSPETEWLSREAFIPDAATKKLLERVATSRLLGGTIRAEFERRMDSLFTAMRLQLLSSSVPMRAEGSDSTAIVTINAESKRFQLSPPMQKTLAAFAEWRKQPFAVIDGEVRQRVGTLLDQLGPMQQVIWNTTLLKTIPPTIEAYLKFLSEQMALFPAELQVPAERVFQRGLQRTIEDIVVRAASVQTVSSRIGEDEMSLAVQSLQESAPALIVALRQLSTSSDGSGRQLATVLGKGIAQHMSTLSRWLADRSLYTASITDAKLLQWKPNQSVRALAFELETAEDAQEYLARQREPIEQWSKQYAVPLLTFYNNAGIGAQAALTAREAAEIRQWSLIVRALEGYAAKAPNNSLAKLEEYIIGLGSLTMLTPTELQKAVIQRSGGSAEDYFARKIRDIATDIRRGIVLNADSRFQEDYRKIYRATTAIQRYFPFGQSNQDADPAMVRNYFTTIGNELTFARLLTALGGTIPDAQAQVLTQLATAQEFFRPVLYAADPSGGTYTITLTYRTNRTAEQNASVVYAKVLVQSPNGQENGKLLFTPGEQITVQWRPGDQIGIEIRWAKDAGIIPVQWLEGSYRIVDTRTASFRASGTWSLLRLLADHQVADGATDRMVFRVLTSAPVNPAVTTDPLMVLYFDVGINPSSGDSKMRIPFLNTLPPPR
ncbi:MAG: hypothetical protein KatS3mg039_0121 [Candidatus Kapaibacterium sp.]|nr:MAG: hypothetical protein KatS3mg039_0121 [Candidatus Kapabacteria bacterium]